MDGLECSEINKSALEFSGRIDAEYYKKNYLIYQQEVETSNGQPLSNLASFLIGPFGSSYDTNSYVEKSEYRYIRGQDVKPFFVNTASPRYMAGKDFKRLSQYSLSDGDILVSVVGTLGNACIVQKKDTPAIFSFKSTAIKSFGISPYYLMSYLNSKIGRHLLLRKERGAIQKGLNLDDLKTLTIPVVSIRLQNIIREVVLNAQRCLNDGIKEYNDVKFLLLDKIHSIYDDKQQNCGRAIKSFSESFLQSGRLDAEYYQPKYDKIRDNLKRIGCNTVGNQCRVLDANFIPKINQKYKYIELSNIGVSGEITGCDVEFGGCLPTRARRIVHTGDVIVSSIEGSLQSCALVTEEYDGALCSTGFYVLNSNKINSETLLVLFKSEPIQALLKQQCTGTILTAFSKEGLQSIPLPNIDAALQQTIAEKVQNSFALRRQAKELLDMAVHAVEIAIENGEDAAMEYLSENNGPA